MALILIYIYGPQMSSICIKDYNMSILYHPDKDNMVEAALSRLFMGGVSHVKETKQNLVKYFHRLAFLGVLIKDYPNLVEVKSMNHLNPLTMEFKESVLRNMKESFS